MTGQEVDMSKKARSRSQLKRRLAKARLKAAQKARYAEYAESGNNSKRSKISRRKGGHKVRVNRRRVRNNEKVEVLVYNDFGYRHYIQRTRRQLNNTCSFEQLRKDVA